MSLSDRFITRPVLTSVCSLVIFILGLLAYESLPIDFLPDIAPPKITVTAESPGGNASFVELSITDQLEDILSDTPGVDYITSSSQPNQTSITLYLDPDTSADTASLDVQNRVQKAKSTLPQITQDKGISISQTTDTAIAGYLITSTEGQHDAAYLTTLVKNQLQKQIQLISGVGRLDIFPTRPLFEISVDSDLLRAYDLSAEDVKQSIRSQNYPAFGGSVGAQQVGENASYIYPIMIEDSGYLQSLSDFENIFVKRLASGAVLSVKDIGNVKYISSSDYVIKSSQGFPGVFITVNLESGSNAVVVGENVGQLIEKFQSSAPSGIKVVRMRDRKAFILDSISNVQDALGLAIVLVVLILLLFLQNWRTIVIPGLAIPISIFGTFIFLRLFGFTLNFLTMTALVLATGLVVDDAILVVQEVSSNIKKGMTSVEAAFASMNNLSGAIISTSLVLVALFLPVTLVSGPIGNIYIRFAITIICSIAISTFNALTFSPMMSALLLSSGPTKPTSPWIGAFLGAAVGLLLGFFTKASFGNLAIPISTSLFAFIGLKIERVYQIFNQVYSKAEEIYERLLNQFLKKSRLVCASLLPLALVTLYLFKIIPYGLIPNEDMGNLNSFLLLNPGTSLTAAQPVSDQARNILRGIREDKESGLLDFVTIDFRGGPIILYMSLTPLDQRRNKDQSIDNIKTTIASQLAALPTRYFPPVLEEPMIQGFGADSSTTISLIDKSSGRYSINELFDLAQRFSDQSSQKPSIQSITTQFSPDNPTYELKIDRSLLGSLNLTYEEVVNTISTLASSSRVNQTSLEGGPKDVNIISQPQDRSTIEDILDLSLQTSQGDFVKLREVASYELVTSPAQIDHFNFQRSIEYKVVSAPGYSTGQVMRDIKDVFSSLDFNDIGYEFTGLSRVQNDSGSVVVFLFLMAALTVFLVLSALYESYITSLVIMVTVPIAILGSLVFIYLRSMDINVFAQIGFLMLIGLAAKNSILVVEAADQRVSEGVDIFVASAEAGKERLKPILMTSIASLAGFFPLVIAQNAGANTQQSIGTVVFGGLLMGTALSLFVVPSVYVLIKNLETRIFPRSANATLS